jgi:hypothetical protein
MKEGAVMGCIVSEVKRSARRQPVCAFAISQASKIMGRAGAIHRAH